MNLSYDMRPLDAGENIHGHLLAPWGPTIHGGASLSVESSITVVVATGDARLVIT